MRTKKLAWNTISSLIYQLTSLICGFILPQLILHSYGSEVNGLVNSVAQFLQVVALLELGVGAVIQSSLYSPLARKDNELVSKIVVSGSRFFKRIAQILAFYVIILMAVYPKISNQNFDSVYTAALIFAMSISSFAQYYFGIVDRLLLTADQRGYIQYTAQSITLVVNTIACAALISFGSSIHMVKLVTSIIFLIRPLALRIYVNRHYKIDRKITYDVEPIQQKWNGIAQHVAAFILDGTDNIVLTLFSTLTNVSVYSVYHLIIFGIKNLFLSLMNGIQSLIGEMWAKRELKELTRFFARIEWIIHTGVTYLFGCTAVLIVPFVQVYTKGIADADYNVPKFAMLLTLANALHCLRLPYNIMILAGGHYKQTQGNYIIAAGLNVVISVVAVVHFGLVGVAVGTLAAMGYQTVWMALYDSRNLIRWPFKKFIRQLLIDIFSVVCGLLLTRGMIKEVVNYLEWLVLAVQIAAVWFGVVFVINIVFYKEHMIAVLKNISLKNLKR
ncbi:MAG: polysaccharide biosynthesis C-terminal domain-containing protein [Lachnospiraceae bacterium]|nr:polysaccharide biosynthesis C-terminal domain-containing protein [Lachnospiraceae bacterium]